MKKILLGTVGLMMAVSAADAANFRGMYGGLKAGYAWNNVEFKDKTPDTAGDFGTWDASPNGIETDVFFGNGFQSGDWYYGGELSIGYGFGKGKKDKRITNRAGDSFDVTIKSERGWKFGVDGRFGKVIDDMLVYTRLGLHWTQYTNKFSLNEVGGGASAHRKTTDYFFSVAPGLGLEWRFAEGMNARFEYVYEHSFTDLTFKTEGGQDIVKLEQPTSHIVSVGVSFAI